MIRIKNCFARGLVTGSIIASILFCSIPVSAAPIRDSSTISSYARESVLYLYSKGIIGSDQNGYFRPKNGVKRGEALKILALALEIDLDNIPAASSFKDVPVSHWAHKYVEAAYREGWITGVGGNAVGVDQLLTREQAALLFIRAIGLTDEDIRDKLISGTNDNYLDSIRISRWAKDGVALASFTGLLKGTDKGLIAPQDKISKEQLAVIIERILDNKDNLNHLTELIKASEKLHADIDAGNKLNYWNISTPIDSHISAVLEGEKVSGENNEYVGISGTGLQFVRGSDYVLDAVITHKTAFGNLGIKSRTNLHIPTSEELYIKSVYPVGSDSIFISLSKPANVKDIENKANYRILDDKGNKLEIVRIQYSPEYNSISVYLTKKIDVRTLLSFELDSIRSADGSGASRLSKYYFYTGRTTGSNTNYPTKIDVTAEQFQKISASNYSVVINGNAIALKDKPIYKNGEILIPETLLKHFSFLQFRTDLVKHNPNLKDVASISIMEDRPPFYPEACLYFKQGSKVAINNHIGHFSFAEYIERFPEQLISMKTSPEKIKGIWMLPLSSIEKTMKIDAFVDENKAILHLSVKELNPVDANDSKHTVLKNAINDIGGRLASADNFKFKASMSERNNYGSIISTTILNIRTTGEYVQLFNEPGTVVFIGVDKKTGKDTTVLDEHTMLISDKGIFERVGVYGSEIGPLIENPQKKYFESTDVLYARINNVLGADFDYLSVQKLGQQVINGKNVTKYRIDIPVGQKKKLLDEIIDMTSYGEWLSEVKNLQEAGINIVLYVDSTGNLVREIITLDSFDLQGDSSQNLFDLVIEMDFNYSADVS